MARRVLVLVAQGAIPHQFLLRFIPKPELEGAQATPEGDGLYTLKQKMRLMTALQIVIGDPRTQMMDVMIADVSREPLEKPR